MPNTNVIPFAPQKRSGERSGRSESGRDRQAEAEALLIKIIEHAQQAERMSAWDQKTRYMKLLMQCFRWARRWGLDHGG